MIKAKLDSLMFFWWLACFIYYKVAFSVAFSSYAGSVSIVGAALLALMMTFFFHVTSFDYAVKEGRHLALLSLGRQSVYFRHTLFGFCLAMFLTIVIGKLIIYGFSEGLSRRISGSVVLYKFGWSFERSLRAMLILGLPLMLHYMICMWSAWHRCKLARARYLSSVGGQPPKQNQSVADGLTESETNDATSDGWESLPEEPWKKRRQFGRSLTPSESTPPIITVQTQSEPLSVPGSGISFSAKTDEAGNLTFSLYDCSDAANEHVGNDVASHVLIDAKDQAAFLLKALDKKRDDFASLSPVQILNEALKRFDGFYALEQWLQDASFPYYEVMDSWA